VRGLPVTLNLSQIEQRFTYFGAYEPNETALLGRWLQAEDVVADVGANVGYFTAHMAGFVGARGRVYAFEPNPSLLDGLRHLESAAPGVIEVNPLAVLDDGDGTDRTVSFFVNPEHLAWSSTVSEATSKVEPIRVPAMSLSEFFHARGVVNVDFIKIDVEGAESQVLLGLRRYLDSGPRPAILCEVCPTVPSMWSRTIEGLEYFQKGLGYAAFACGSRGSLTPLSLSDLRALTAVTNVVLAPPGSPRLERFGVGRSPRLSGES
jgi:FkbM family methyltransferase